MDLSDVLFIATANSLSTIPRPLLDRMEIIEINTYTQNEKLHIAKEHLIEKQMKANGIKAKQLTISDKAIEDIILSYTVSPASVVWNAVWAISAERQHV